MFEEILISIAQLRAPPTRRLGRKRGWLGSKFVVDRLDETEDHAPQTGNPGNVG
jgi:hypothetical protein